MNQHVFTVSQEDIVLSLTVEGDPVAHQRPRFTRTGHTYTPEKSAGYKKLLAYRVRERMTCQQDDCPFGLWAVFYRSNRQRIDIDNLLKSVLDACTLAGVWKDDSQVREVFSRLYTGESEPRVEFAVYRMDSTTSGNKCLKCGKDIPQGKGTKKKFCDSDCWRESTKTEIVCAHCGKPFTLPKSFARGNPGYPRKFCSRDCSIAAHQQKCRIKGKESEKWKCTVCGGRVSRKEYTVCRGCSMKQRNDPTSNYWKLRHDAEGRPTAVKGRVIIAIEEVS